MKDRLLAAAAAIGALGYLYSDYKMPRLELGDPLGPRAFPAIVGLLLLASAIMLAWETRRTLTKRAPAARSIPATPDTSAMSPTRPVVVPNHLPVLLGMVAWTIVYYAVFEPMGYILATIPYLFGLLSYFHRGKSVMNLVIALGFTGIAYSVFSHLLGVQLPSGLLDF